LTGSNVGTAFTEEAATAGASVHTISGKENSSEHKRKRGDLGDISTVERVQTNSLHRSEFGLEFGYGGP
jgi:hypothetical protein